MHRERADEARFSGATDASSVAKRSRRVAAFAVALFHASCGGSLPEPVYSSQPDAAFDEVPFAPPPARVELVPARPSDRRAVWLDGEWTWTGLRWAWQYGSWVVPPGGGATYSMWTLIRRRDGALLFAPGTFRAANGSELSSPPALSVAKARDEDVVDPEGRTERTAPNVPPEGSAPPR